MNQLIENTQSEFVRDMTLFVEATESKSSGTTDVYFERARDSFTRLCGLLRSASDDDTIKTELDTIRTDIDERYRDLGYDIYCIEYNVDYPKHVTKAIRAKRPDLSFDEARALPLLQRAVHLLSTRT